MARISPTIEGFRAAVRRPSFALAEVMWRWIVGATGCALFFFGTFEFLNTLPVSNGDVLLLRSRQPVLVGQAIAHIFRGSLRRGALAAIVAALLLALLWIAVASIGRRITVRALLEYFAERRLRDRRAGARESGVEQEARFSSGTLSGLVSLNFLRAATMLAAVGGLFGASMIASFVSRAGLGFLLLLFLGGLVWLAWVVLNWFLSLASVFATRDGTDALTAFSDAVSLSRERFGAVLAVSTWAELGHVAAFLGATAIVSLPLGLASVVRAKVMLFAIALVTLAYFAVVDWLYMARLAGYVCIAQMPEEMWAAAPSPSPPLPQAPTVLGTVDPDELILSDVPEIVPAEG